MRNDGDTQMNAHRIPTRIARGLTIIRQNVGRLDSAQAHGNTFEARMLVKSIQNECDQLRQYLGLLVEKSGVSEKSS